MNIKDIYDEYQSLQKTLSDYVLVFGMENELYIFDENGNRAAEELGLDKENCLLDGEMVPVCKIPYTHVGIYTSMLSDRGWDLAESELYDLDVNERYITKVKGRNEQIKSWPAGRIDYLGSNGMPGESIEYLPADFVKAVDAAINYGEPVTIVQYTDENGKSFCPQCPFNDKIVSPYIENMAKAQMYKNGKERNPEAKKSVREQLNLYSHTKESSRSVESPVKAKEKGRY